MNNIFRVFSVASLFAYAMLPTFAQADLRVSFDEGAPKDRFRIENTGACAVFNATISVDLTTSRGKLIFDVTSQGKGVEVFQPFELVEGAKALKSLPTVTDGQTEVRLDIENLAPDKSIAFTIDVDDTLGQREITVSGSEIAGTAVTYSNGQVQRSAMFSESSTAEVQVSSC